MSTLYEVAVIDTVEGKVVLAPTAVVARDERAAITKATLDAQKDGAEGGFDPNRIQVLVRPFV